MTALSLAAQELAVRGWHVFPLRPRDKTPATRHGLLDASCDLEQVASWRQATPEANVAVACGASGLLVVDLDGDAAVRAWARLAARHGGHRSTLVAATGKPDGRHLYFAAPTGELPNSAGKLGQGIDTRGRGGYVVAPPSRHPSGRHYRWVETFPPEPAPAPHWLEELLRPPPTPAVGEWRSLPPGAWATRYGQRALEGLCDEMLAAQEGQRNELLVRLAYRAGRIVAAGELEEEAAEQALVEAARQVGLSQVEAARTYRSGSAAGRQAGPAAVCLRDRRT